VADWLDRRADREVTEVLEGTGYVEAVAAWASVGRAEPGLAADAAQVLHLVLEPYRDPMVAAQTRREPALQVQPHQLVDGRANTLYVHVSPAGGDRHRPLLAGLVSQVVDAALLLAAASGGGRLAQPLLVVIDGTLQCTPPAMLDRLASIGPAVGIQLLSLFTGLDQLEHAFGRDVAVQLASRHRGRLALAEVHDDATLDYLGSLSQWTAGGPVDVIRRLRDDQGVLLYGNLPPMHLTLRPWQRDHLLRSRVRPDAGELSGPAREARLKRLWGWARDQPDRQDDPRFGGYPPPPGSDRGTWGQGPV
jgi:hypothetical protein